MLTYLDISDIKGATIGSATGVNALYLGSNLIYTSATYDAATIALLARMAVQPSQALAELIDKTIIDLKAAGLWDITDKLHKWDLHTEQASLLDWKNATHNALIGAGTPIFTPKYGVQTKGLEQASEVDRSWIDLNFTPSTDCEYGSLNSIGFSLDDLVGTTITSYNFGAKTTANTAFLMFRTKESDAVARPWMFANGITARVYNGASGIKLFYCERQTSSTVSLWKDPLTQVVGTGNNSVAMINQKLVLGGYREYNGGVNRYGISTSTFWLGASMTNEQRIAWWDIINYWKANVGSTF